MLLSLLKSWLLWLLQICDTRRQPVLRYRRNLASFPPDDDDNDERLLFGLRAPADGNAGNPRALPGLSAGVQRRLAALAEEERVKAEARAALVANGAVLRYYCLFIFNCLSACTSSNWPFQVFSLSVCCVWVSVGECG